MSTTQAPARTLRGVSFDLAELILIRSWSEASALRMEIRLDHASETEEFEEVLALHVGESSLCRWILWRDAEAVFVQPLIGRTQRYASVAQAFETLADTETVTLTDIQPTAWPA